MLPPAAGRPKVPAFGGITVSPFFTPRVPARASLLPSELTRVACRLQYNGALFHGWEAKPSLRTVEGAIADAASAVAKSRVDVTAASRTDAGAHATGQVVHFDVPRARAMATARSWVSALNRRLPGDVRVTEAAFACPAFDGRRSAAWRRYRYTILTAAEPSVFLAPLTWHYYQRALNVERMHEAAQLLRSEKPRDLSAFRKAAALAGHTRVAVRNIAVRRAGPGGSLVELDVEATWFVYGMMRLVAAALVQVGGGLLSVEEFAGIVRDGNRAEVKFSAPPNGLCLLKVGYPAELDPFRGMVSEDGARQASRVVEGSRYVD